MDYNLNNYNLLIGKLESFIKKYYTGKLIRGIMIFLAIILALFLIFNLLENQFYFSKSIRKVIFFSFIGTSIISFIYLVLNPLSKYLKFGKTLSYENAAIIIGNHFSDVKDKLLNVLQLHNQTQSTKENELLLAGIDQKSNEIKLVPFRNALNLNQNKKYLKYLLPPALILFLIALFAPNIIKSSTERIIKNNIEFSKPAPFTFQVQNKSLEALQYSDLELVVKTEGKVIPADVFIDVGNFEYRMTKISDEKFKYQFKNLQEDVEFSLYSGTVHSGDYKITVFPKPQITDFSVFVDYPDYTGQKDELIKNTGDLMILEGSKLNWKFTSLNTDIIKMLFENENKRFILAKDGNKFTINKRIVNEEIYKIFSFNSKVNKPDSASYSINVIKDKFPVINVDQVNDSTDKSKIYFIGDISDDYGFTSLTFNYRIGDQDGSISPLKIKQLNFEKMKNSTFKYFMDFSDIGLKPGQFIKYYFEVKDNDAVNGPKKSNTGEQEYRTLTDKQYTQEEQKNEEDIKKNLEKIMQESRKIQEKLKKLREKMMQKKETEWQDKKELNKLLDQEKEMQKMLEEIKSKMDENMKRQEQYNKVNESILNKQEQLQKMFNESLSEEQKDLMKKIEDLMNELQKDQMMDEMQNMSMDQNKLEKQMDRMLELFKQLELEKEMKDLVKNMNDLADKQQKLSEDTRQSKEETKDLKEKQDKLNKDFDDMQKKLDELSKKNKELEHPKNLADDNKEKMDDIDQDMKDSSDDLKKEDKPNASKSQKSAANKMKKMADNLDLQMSGSDKEQHQEDEKALRQILDNILTLSFEQERLMNKTNGLIINSPAFKQTLVEQHNIQEDFKIIEDSLQALSKRVMEIQTFVNDKVGDIKKSLTISLDRLTNDNNFPGARDFPGAIKSQRETMTGLNDLALMLNESLKQMKQNSNGSPGSGSCDKPGGKGKKPGSNGKFPMDKIAKGQESLTDKMKEMLSKKDGKGGQGGMPKEFAEAAKQQAELRKALEEMKRGQQEQGGGNNSELQKMIDDMNKVETDLVNKKLDAQLIRRQQDITTRLLEADKAQRQRGFEEKRESTTGKELEKKLPPSIEKYIRDRQAQLDLYKSSSPDLKPFYRDLVRDYIESVKNIK